MCFFPETTTASMVGSWGINDGQSAAKNGAGTFCTNDYVIVRIRACPVSIYLKKCEILILSSLQIPQGTTSAIATSTTPKIAGDRFCGTFFDAALAGDATDSDTICTREYPFRISVNFDQDEVRLKNQIHTGCPHKFGTLVVILVSAETKD